MASNSPPKEQNKLSVYHINTASYSGPDFNIPAYPCTAWRWSSQCLEEQGSNHVLPAHHARKAVSAGKSLELKEDKERWYLKHPWWSQSDLVQYPGWLMAGKSAHQEGKEEVLSSLHILLGFLQDENCIWATGYNCCWWAWNLSSPSEFVYFSGGPHTVKLGSLILHCLKK